MVGLVKYFCVLFPVVVGEPFGWDVEFGAAIFAEGVSFVVVVVAVEGVFCPSVSFSAVGAVWGNLDFVV